MGQFCPTIESMRQIEIKHAAPHHAPAKLATNGGRGINMLSVQDNYCINVFLLTASRPLPHKDKIPDVPGTRDRRQEDPGHPANYARYWHVESVWW